MTRNISLPQEQVAAYCQRWNIVELPLLVSVLRHAFRQDSDVDVLVRFHPDAHPTLFDMVDMKDELERLFGLKVDLVSLPRK